MSEGGVMDTLKKKAGMCESCDQHQRTLLVAVDNYLTCLVCAIKSNDKKALAKFKR